MSVQADNQDEEPQIDWDRQKLAQAYARQRRLILITDTAVGAIYVLALLLTGASTGLRNLLEGLDGRPAVVGSYFVAFYVIYAVILLPVSYVAFQGSRGYGLSTQSTLGWLSDWLKGSGITLVFGLILVEVLYYLIPAFPSWWWLIMAMIVVVFSVVLANLGPILLVPLFYRLTPIENEELAERLVDLSTRAGARVRGVYRINLSSKTTAANAALMGLGNTRRIVLGDTLLDRYTPEEVETIYAHELGHHVHGDIPIMMLAQSVTLLIGFYAVSLVLDAGLHYFGIGSAADVASLPLFALLFGVFGGMWMPVTNALSRWVEHRADVYAIESTGKVRAFRNAMVRLCNQNLAVLHPSRWVELVLYDHPAIGSRIRLAEGYVQRRR